MIHFTCILEDCVLTATLRYEDESYVYDVSVCDNLSGDTGKAIWTKAQWSAVMILVNDDESLIESTSILSKIYEIAETAVAMLPKNCRLIP